MPPSMNPEQFTDKPGLAGDEPVQLIADTIGQMMEFWGFKHIMGRLWTILYLSSKPLSAPELACRMGASSGSVSMALRDLLEWGAIRRICLKEDRKDHYTAEGNIWKLVSRVLSQREGQRLEGALDNMEEALKVLELEQHTGENHEVYYQIQQLKELKKLTSLAKRLLKLLLLHAKIDVTPLIDLTKLTPPPSNDVFLPKDRTHW